MNKTHSITVIVKPTASCNMRCRYCYHADTRYPEGALSGSRLERLIRLLQEEYSHINYIWHGGEPLLCGIPYFREAVALQDKYRREGQIIRNNLQTNGTLLNDETLDFLKEHRFSLSISYDGPEECNDLRGNTQLVEDRIRRAETAGLNPGILSVIHRGNCSKQIAMYRYIKALGVPMKFNPMFISGAASGIPDYALDVREYVASLKELFLYWLDDETAVHLDTIDQYLWMYFYGRGRDCQYGSCLYHWISIDHAGTLYPCGRSYPESCALGCIDDYDSIGDVFRHEHYTDLVKAAILRRNRCQQSCSCYGICLGGCGNGCLLAGSAEEPDPFFCAVLQEMLPLVRKTLDKALRKPGRIHNPLLREYLENNRQKGENAV